MTLRYNIPKNKNITELYKGQMNLRIVTHFVEDYNGDLLADYFSRLTTVSQPSSFHFEIIIATTVGRNVTDFLL
jgi:hypothetical protein